MTILALVALASFVALIALSFRMLESHRLPSLPSDVWIPSLSVIVPARNEATRVGNLVRSVRVQDHPHLELIVVDDRSTDGTSAAAREVADGDARVRVLRVERRPERWQGKLHALAAGAEVASGDWLLFADADQRFSSPDVLSRLSVEFERRGDVAISLIGRNVRQHWWDRWWIQPIVNNPIVWGTVLAVQRLRPTSPWLIGSLAMRRATYVALGGAASAARCAAGAYDDWGWAATLAARGKRTSMIYVPEFEDATNFERFGDVVRGVARWLAGIFSYRKGGWVVAVLIAIAITFAIGVAASVAVQLLRGGTPDLASVAVAAIVPTLGIGHCLWNREPILFSLGFYLVAPLVLLGIAGAAWVRLRNRVMWRGEPMHIVSRSVATSTFSVDRSEPTIVHGAGGSGKSGASA